MRGQLERELPMKKAWRPRTSRQAIDAVCRMSRSVIAGVRWSTTRVARLGIRFFVGCALIIPMIIQTIRLDPVWTDGAANVSRQDPSGADQIDAEHPSGNRKVVGSNPTSGSILMPGACLAAAAGQRAVRQPRSAPGAPVRLRQVVSRGGQAGQCASFCGTRVFGA